MATEITEALHLFRGLLRAASYLPDKLARTYVHTHTIYRFRNAAAITPSRLLTAQRAIQRLQGAAEGELKPLLAVLNMTYGRTGKRRRELMTKLYAPESAMYRADIKATRKLNQIPQSVELYQSQTRLEQFIINQTRHHPPESQRIRIKDLKPDIPEESIWGRPLPLKRQANIKKRFLATTLDRVLPPMPQRHWDRLRNLTTGVIPFQPPPPRRKPARSLAESGAAVSEATLLQLPLLKKPIRVIRSQETDRSNAGRHRITPRFMRRVYAHVWASSNIMVPPEEGRKERGILWGGGRSAAAQGRVTSPGTSDLELFEGASEVKDTVKVKG